MAKKHPWANLEAAKLENTDKVIWVHPESECRPSTTGYCSIHNPSPHHMRSFPQNWRTDRRLMERVCPHGVGHPDPDHMAFIQNHMSPSQYVAEGVHGCDGCCIPPELREDGQDEKAPVPEVEAVRPDLSEPRGMPVVPREPDAQTHQADRFVAAPATGLCQGCGGTGVILGYTVGTNTAYYPCSYCNGSGAAGEVQGQMICPDCEGGGSIVAQSPSFSSTDSSMLHQTCGRCDGRGTVDIE